MLSLQSRLRPNEAEVAAKVLDGEAIIINLSNGMYYSMDRVGGLIWEMIEGQSSLEETVAEIIARYDVSPQQAQADVQRVADELVQEKLVMPRGRFHKPAAYQSGAALGSCPFGLLNVSFGTAIP